MANAASTIEIELEIRQAINRLDRLQRELTQSTQSFNKAAQATRKFEGAINKAKAGLVAFFAAISIQKLAQLSDAMTQFENRVKLATNSLVQQLAVQQQLFQVAQKTALPLEDVGQLYSRLRIAAEQLGASQRDLINLTETVGLALKASGTSAASAQGALLQLGQALNSPIVQAEEFNSLIDGMPNLLKQVEKQLGLTAGGLKKFVTDGQLSNKKFFDAILASQKALTQQANSSASTIEQANQRVANSFTFLIGAIDDKLGASKFFTGFIDGLASGIDKLSNFLGLTTQATGGGGGGGDLDKVIGEEAKPTPPNMPSLFLQANIESLAKMLNSNASKTEVQKEINKFRDYYNQTLETAFKEGGYTFTPFPDVYPDDKIIMPLAEFIRDDYIPILQMLEGMLAAAPNLTFFEEIREELLEQIRLFTILEENAQRTTDAIVSGVSGAGPNASRAANIAQSKSIEEAAAKLILSNEKVAAAIDKSFEILFDTIDPLIDLLGDLISAINRLIGALIQNATNAAEGLLDTVGLGPNSYIFGGGLARDLEDAFGFGPGSSKATGPTAMQKAFAEADKVFLAIEQEQSTLEKLQPKIDELAALLGSLSLSDIIERFTEQTQKAIEPLQAEIEKYEFALTQTGPGGGANFFADFYNQQIQTATDKIAEVNEKTSIVISGLISEFLSEPLATLDDLERSATDSIAAIEFQNLSAEEQIQFRYDEAIATIEQQKALADLVDDEELRTQLLDSVNRATQAQNDLLAKQQEELQKLNEERERELNLQNQNNLQSGLIDVFKDFEKGLSDISKIIDGLNTQINDLLFSDFNLAPASDSLEMATETYADLFAAALDPEATEEDVKAFQGFVDTYLRGARDVFKSSTAYRQIFDQVLVDLQQLGLAYGQSAPVNLIENIKDELESLETEFGTSLTTLIQELDRLGTVFANQSYAYSGVISVDLGTIDTTFDSSGFTGAINDLNLTIANTITAFIQTMDASKTALDNFNQTGTVTPVTPAPVMGTLLEQLAVGGNAGNFSGNIEASEDYAFATGNNSIADTASALVNAIKANSSLDISDFVFGISWGMADSDTNTVAFYPSVDIPEGYYSILSTGVRDKQKYGFRRGGLVDPMDTIPAMLSPGEYILSPETVRRYGVSNLNRLNAGDSAAINGTSDPEVKRLLAELIVAVKENDTEVNVFTDMQGQTKASIEEFRSELRERTRRQGDKFLPARYI